MDAKLYVRRCWSYWPATDTAKIHMKKTRKLTQVVLGILFASVFFPSAAFAMEVPVSQTEQMIDGRQTLVKVFEVDSSVTPESLIEENLEQNGYHYYMTSIVKDAVIVEDTKEITQDFTVTISAANEDKARLEALESMPAFIEYNENGYTGKLYAIPSSLESVITGRTNHSGTKTIQKIYTEDYNDDSLIPTTADGYSLSSISWSDNGYVADSSVPDSYTATATYAKRYSYSTVNGWDFTMTYVGDVDYEHEDVLRYTLTYTGEKIGFFDRLFGHHDASGNAENGNHKSILTTLLGVFSILLAAAALGVGGFTLIRFLASSRVTIYARDEVTGEFEEIDKVWFKRKDALINIDTLLSPESIAFRVVLKAALAEELKGKVITIKAGNFIEKQTVADAGGVDYLIDFLVA